MKLFLRQKQKQIILSVLFLNFCFCAFAQYNENFEAFAVRDSFLKFGYTFQTAAINNASNTVISGNRSLRVGPLSNPVGTYQFTSGFLNLSQNATIAFKHRATNNSSSALVKLYLVDANNTLIDSSASFSATPSAKTETVQFNGRTGWFRLRWVWKGIGGAAYGVLDDVTSNITANSVTGSSSYLADIRSLSRITFRNYGTTDSVDMKFIFVNFGPDAARNGHGTITLPSGFFKDNIILYNGTFQSSNNRFSFGQLAVGDSATIVVRSRVINYGSFTINTTFTGFDFQADPTASNNSASASYFGGTVLPVKLLAFTAQKNASGQIQLAWTTVQEEKIQQYIIERSNDGVQFFAAGQLAAKGRQTETGYNFQDGSRTASGQLFYRLKIVGQDGQVTYSEIVKIATDKEGTLSAAPNPFQSNLSVQFNSNQIGQVQVSLFNSAGAAIQKMSQAVKQGINQLNLSGLSALQPGVYFISVQNGKEIFTKQLVKN